MMQQIQNQQTATELPNLTNGASLNIKNQTFDTP